MDTSSGYVKRFKTLNKNYDFINLGTSHGSDFIYSVYGINGKAFNWEANTIYYDLQDYKYLKPQLNKGAVIIIPLSYFSFGLDENRTDKGEDNGFDNQFYHFLPVKNIHDYSAKKNIKVFIQEAKKNYFGFFEQFSTVEKKKVEKGKDIDIEKAKAKKLKYLAYSSKINVKHHKIIGTYADSEVNIGYLSNLIKDAIDSGYKPVLVTTPYYSAYNKGFGEQWLDEHYYKNLLVVKEEFDIPYFNYSTDNRFDSNPDLFRNSDHLNQKGRKYFSKIFFQDLAKAGLVDKRLNYNIPMDTIKLK